MSELCFELCAVKLKPTNNAFDFEDHIFRSRITHLRIIEANLSGRNYESLKNI